MSKNSKNIGEKSLCGEMTGMTGVEVDYLKHHVSKKMGLPV
jgi:hypothetical protein